MAMFEDRPNKPRTYEYVRYMRNGGTKRITAVVRSRTERKRAKVVKNECN